MIVIGRIIKTYENRRDNKLVIVNTLDGQRQYYNNTQSQHVNQQDEDIKQY